MRLKLQAHPVYQGLDDAELSRKVETFSEKEPFREAYFSKYIDTLGARVVLDTSADHSKRLSKEVEEQERQRQASQRFDELFNLRLNLIIRTPSGRPSRRSTSKSPILFSVQVGDYVFEWDETSLVVPMELEHFESKPILLSPVQMQSMWPEVISEEKQQVEEAIRKKDCTMQIDLHYRLTDKKDKLLFKFIDTVVEYNRSKTYHKRSCNNQTFLADAMKSLGIDQPGKFSSTIQDHIKSLKPSRDLARKQVNDHDQLNAIAAEAKADSTSKEDIEFLVSKYFLFHVRGWEQEEEHSSDRWQCPAEDCGLPRLEGMLERRSSISSTSPS